MDERSQTDRDKAPVTQEQVASDFDQLTESYERDINQSLAFSGIEHKFFIDKKREKLVALAEEQFGDAQALDVLDLGCGLGAYHSGLKGVFRELHGADVSAASVNLAAQRHSWVHYQSYDGIHLRYPDNHFDMVFTITVMHHVPPAHWQRFADEMHRVLKPGGIALVFEHNPYNPATQYIVRSCKIDKDAVLLTPRKLRTYFRKPNFEGVVTRTMFSVPPKGKFLTYLDSLFAYLPIGAQYYLKAIKK